MARVRSDEIDVTAATISILGKDIFQLLHTRSDGARAALSILSASRSRIDKQRTINRYSLSALLRTFDLGIGARQRLTARQVKQISAWRDHSADSIDQKFAREGARFLATSILAADQLLKENSKAMSKCLIAVEGASVLAIGRNRVPRFCQRTKN